MKVNEIINSSVDEGWKDWAATLGVAGALGIGANTGVDNNPQPKQSASGKVIPATQQPVSQQPAKPPVAKPAITKIDLDKLSNALPAPGQLLKKHAMQSGLKGEELIQFLAQAQHETLNFTRTEEIGNKKYFRKYDPKFNPKKAKILGNVKVGDGERYKGRGFLQITGRWNYRAAGKALGLPLEQKPHLVNSPDVAAKVSIWYWNTFVKPEVKNFKDVRSVTKEINPSLNGLQDRHAKFNYLMKVVAR